MRVPCKCEGLAAIHRLHTKHGCSVTRLYSSTGKAETEGFPGLEGPAILAVRKLRL